MRLSTQFLWPVVFLLGCGVAAAQGAAGGAQGAQGAQGQETQTEAAGTRAQDDRAQPPVAATPSTEQRASSSRPAPPPNDSTAAQPARSAQESEQTQTGADATIQETVRPNTPNAAARQDERRRRQAAVDQQSTDQLPPSMRGVGERTSIPDCTRLRGIEKSECERRDTSRDDLPAGETTTQPER